MSGLGRVWVGRIEVVGTIGLVYLVSVGVECVCVKGFLVLVLVLGWTQCLPQGAGALPAMLRGRMTGFPNKWVAGPQGRCDRWVQFAPPTVAHQPRACCIRLVLPHTIIQNSSHTISKSANHTPHSETKHQRNANSEMVFHKAASYHPHFSIYRHLTLQHHMHQ